MNWKTDKMHSRCLSSINLFWKFNEWLQRYILVDYLKALSDATERTKALANAVKRRIAILDDEKHEVISFPQKLCKKLMEMIKCYYFKFLMEFGNFDQKLKIPKNRHFISIQIINSELKNNKRTWYNIRQCEKFLWIISILFYPFH